MNKCLLKYLFLINIGIAAAQAQVFRNLGFDEAQTNDVDHSSGEPIGSATNLIPGWTLTREGITNKTLLFNYDPFGGNSAVVYDSSQTDITVSPLGGFAFYCVFQNSKGFELSQVGYVPENSGFFSYRLLGVAFEVRIDDELLNPVFPGDYRYVLTDRINILAFDVARFRGKRVRLSLQQRGSNVGYSYLDSLQFINGVPRIEIRREGARITVRWPSEEGDFVLHRAGSLASVTTWGSVADPVTFQTQRSPARLDATGSSGFFRLGLLTAE